MPRARSIGVAAVLLCGLARGEEPAKLQVVTPRPEGISAAGINGRGDIVGFQWVEMTKYAGVIEQAPIFARGKTITRLPLLPGYTAMFPAAISDGGVVVGRAGKPAPKGVYVPLRNQAFFWELEAGVKPLGVLEGDGASFASDITPDGGRISGFSVGPDRVRACYWERSGEGWKIAPLPHEFKLGANAVPMSDNGRRMASVDGEKPCLWSQSPDGKWSMEVIGESGSFVPRGVNDEGTVAGVRFTYDGLNHAMIWTRAKGLVEIKPPEGYVKGEANAINNAGLVVGMFDGPSGSKVGPAAFAFADGKARIIAEGGPNFTSATALNDRGQVTGVFEAPEEEDEHAGQPIKVKPKEPVKESPKAP